MGVFRKDDRVVVEEMCPENGSGVLHLDSLFEKKNFPENLGMYSRAVLEKGAEVGFHTHNGECENYYILSGTGEYNDNGKITVVKAGDATYTPSGHGHGIKNIGKEPLEFMALVVRD